VLRDLFVDHAIHKPEQWLRLFSMFGTNPRFYEILIQFKLLKATTEEILEKSWLGLIGLFSDELNKMLLPELKKLSHVYTGILSAMAKFIQGANEIANQAGINTTSLGNYLPFLIKDLDLVYKEIPVTENQIRKTHAMSSRTLYLFLVPLYREKQGSSGVGTDRESCPKDNGRSAQPGRESPGDGFSRKKILAKTSNGV